MNRVEAKHIFIQPKNIYVTLKLIFSIHFRSQICLQEAPFSVVNCHFYSDFIYVSTCLWIHSQGLRTAIKIMYYALLFLIIF
jgi:hypothetical protein